jgi:hypothetical protein
MPLNKKILSENKNPIFIETGTHTGGGIEIALDCDFPLIMSCEYNYGLVEAARRRFLATSNVIVFHGCSRTLIPSMLALSKGACVTFWLDAHPCVDPMSLFDPAVPLIEELIAIKRNANNTKGNTLLIDDIRTLSNGDKTTLIYMIGQLWPTASVVWYDDDLGKRDILCVRNI